MTLRRFQAKEVIRFGSLFLILSGTCALLAWALRWRALLQLKEGGPLITCDSAICFMLAGCGFWAALRGAERAMRMIGLLLVVLGAIYLEAGVNHLWVTVHAIFPDLTAAMAAPLPATACRVSVATAAVFLLLGSLLFLMAKERLGRPELNAAAFLASSIMATGVFGGMCHLAGIVAPGTWTGYLMNMSLPTAICSVVAGASAGALFWMRAERSERRLSTGAATLTLLGLLLLFGGINAAVVSNARLGVETRTELERVAQQESLVDGIVAELRKAETGQRGFLLTHRELYLQSYQQGLEEVQRSLEALQSYRAGDRRRGELQRLTEEKLAELALTIRLQREQKGDEALAVVEGEKDSRSWLLLKQKRRRSMGI